ncbi:MAG: HNH endonuclease signature motif containing protein [Planctomycetota bacterium]
MDVDLFNFVRQRAGDVCEYCQMPQAAHVLTFPIDHIIARQHGGETTEDNLALSCTRCNSFKGPNIAGIDPETKELTRLYNPRKDSWNEHFSIQYNNIAGTSSEGRTTVFVLQMNHPDYLALRESLIAERLFPPKS